jgi:hypothetical protein
VHKDVGTPGAVNSVTLRQIARSGSRNMGPLISKVLHAPAVPAASVPVTVTARVYDPDGVSSVTLHYSLDTPKPDGDPALLSIDMLDPDGDGVYTCEIPGQLAKASRLLHHRARCAGQAVRFPLDFVVHRTYPLVLDPDNASVNDSLYCIYRHDAPFTGKPRSFRFWMNQARETYPGTRLLHSQELVDGTFVFQNRDVYYNSKIRFSGSPWARQAWVESYRISMPSDNPLQGTIHSFNMEDHQDGGARSAKERISHYIFRWHQGQTIVPYSLQWYVQLQVNDKVNEVREMVQVPNSDFLARWFPNDDVGSFFEMDDRHVFDDSGNRADSIDGRLFYPPYGATALGADKEQYRYYFRLRSGDDLDDFSELIKLAKLLTAATTPNDEFDAKIWDAVDVESFCRYWSIRMNTDDWDCWGSRRGKELLPLPAQHRRPVVRAALGHGAHVRRRQLVHAAHDHGDEGPPVLEHVHGSVAFHQSTPDQSVLLRDHEGNARQAVPVALLAPYAQKLDTVARSTRTSRSPTALIDQRRRTPSTW